MPGPEPDAPRSHRILLALLLALATVVHIWFFAVFDLPTLDHEYNHTGHGAVWSAQQLRRGEVGAFVTGAFTYTGVRQPQLVSHLMGLACAVFGTSRTVMRLAVNLPFWLLLIVATYMLGKALWGSRVGLLGAFVATGMPQLMGHSRRGELCFFEAALLVTALFLLVRSDWLARRRWAVACGAALGLTLHTHPVGLFYVGLVLAPVAAFALLRGGRARRLNLALVLAIVGAAFALFYPAALLSPAGPQPMTLLPARSADAPFGEQFVDALVRYGADATKGIGWVNLAALAWAVVLVSARARVPSFRRQDLGPALLLLGLAVLPFFALASGGVHFREIRNTEHIVPSYPLAALLCAWAACAVPRRLGQAALVGAGAVTWLLCIVSVANITLKVEPAHPWIAERLRKDKKRLDEMALLHFTVPGAGEVRDYFREELRGRCALVYGYNLPIPAPNRKYFDDLLMHGIVQPLYPGHTSQPARTPGPRTCDDTVYLVLIYKDVMGMERITLRDGRSVYVPHNFPPDVRGILWNYECSVIKEFRIDSVPWRPLVISVVRGTRPAGGAGRAG